MVQKHPGSFRQSWSVFGRFRSIGECKNVTWGFIDFKCFFNCTNCPYEDRTLIKISVADEGYNLTAQNPDSGSKISWMMRSFGLRTFHKGLNSHPPERNKKLPIESIHQMIKAPMTLDIRSPNFGFSCEGWARLLANLFPKINSLVFALLRTAVLQGPKSLPMLNHYQCRFEVHLRYHILSMYKEYGTKILVIIWPPILYTKERMAQAQAVSALVILIPEVPQWMMASLFRRQPST